MLDLTRMPHHAKDPLVQTGLYPVFQDGKKVRDIKLEEVWRRIE